MRKENPNIKTITDRTIGYEPVLCTDCIYSGALSFTSFTIKCCNPKIKKKYDQEIITHQRDYTCELAER